MINKHLCAAIGTVLTIIAVSTVPLLFGAEVKKRLRKGMPLTEALVNVFRPSDKWAPRDPALRRAYRDFVTNGTPPPPAKGIDNPALTNEIEIHRF